MNFFLDIPLLGRDISNKKERLKLIYLSLLCFNNFLAILYNASRAILISDMFNGNGEKLSSNDSLSISISSS